MKEPLKWKDRLLSSSIPLEYDVAKILASKGFSVSFDFAYQRLDEKEEKDFSVDISGLGFCPFRENSPIETVVHFLVECKYRNPNIKWLFLPDIHEGESSHFSSRGPIKIVDEFSKYNVKNRFGNLPYDLDTCLKGVEVNLQTGDVHETGIVHGVSQLTYGLTSLLKNHISSGLNGNVEDNYPEVMCPILLTTADLFIANENFNLNKILKTDNFYDLVTPSDYLILYSNQFASFGTHCKNVFKFDKLTPPTNLLYYEKIRKNNFEGKWSKNINSNPLLLLSSLEHGLESDFFREIIVCNLKSFPKLITLIKKHIEKVNKSKIILASSNDISVPPESLDVV